jgi:hypothetical protein
MDHQKPEDEERPEGKEQGRKEVSEESWDSIVDEASSMFSTETTLFALFRHVVR